jgi:hypothetical protein
MTDDVRLARLALMGDAIDSEIRHATRTGEQLEDARKWGSREDVDHATETIAMSQARLEQLEEDLLRIEQELSARLGLH